MAPTTSRMRRKLQAITTVAGSDGFPCCPCSPTKTPTVGSSGGSGGGFGDGEIQQVATTQKLFRRLEDDVCPSCACASTQALPEVLGAAQAKADGVSDGNEATTGIVFGLAGLAAVVALVLVLAAVVAIAVLAPHHQKRVARNSTMTSIDPVGELFFEETPVPVGEVIAGPTHARLGVSRAGHAAKQWRTSFGDGGRGSAFGSANPMAVLAEEEAARQRSVSSVENATRASKPMSDQLNPLAAREAAAQAARMAAHAPLRAGKSVVL